MRPRCRCRLLLALLLHVRAVHALIPRVVPSRCHDRVASSRQMSLVRWSTSSPRTQCIMSIDKNSMMSQVPPRLGSAPMWHHPARAVLSSLLASAIVLTGAVPGWEVASSSTERNPTVARAVPSLGVPSASAASFNDEQRAIAETWVSAILLSLYEYVACHVVLHFMGRVMYCFVLITAMRSRSRGAFPYP